MSDTMPKMMEEMFSNMDPEKMQSMMAEMMPQMMEQCFSKMDAEQRKGMLSMCRQMLDQIEKKYMPQEA